MEGIGSRLGRASSRYGPAPVFTGPVRKWKKQWVQASSSLASATTTASQSNNNASSLRLCRWTPIPPNNSDDNSDNPEEPPRRKFRYTPVAVLEERKKEVAKKAEDDANPSRTDPSITRKSSFNDIFDKTDIDNLFNEDPQGSDDSRGGREHAKRRQMGLDLRLKGHDDRPDSDGETD